MSHPLYLHPDLQALIDSLLSFAKSMVGEEGSFNPFGAIMDADGAIQWVAADSGEEFPASQVSIDILTNTFKEMAASGDVRAATICYDALAVPPGKTVKADAIGFALEHHSGESVTALIPYIRKENKDVDCGDLFTVERSPPFFEIR